MAEIVLPHFVIIVSHGHFHSHLAETKSVPVRESPWQKKSEQRFVLPYQTFSLAFCLGLSKL